MVEYFIAYDYWENGNRGKGNGHVYLKEPITEFATITDIEQRFSKEKGYENMVISNFILLK